MDEVLEMLDRTAKRIQKTLEDNKEKAVKKATGYDKILHSKEASKDQKIEALIHERGWGFWAVEHCDEHQFIGFVGLHMPQYDLPVTPCVEIGWRLAKEYWGRGYATEAAHASLEVAFEQLNLPEVYSFASVANKKSQAVMQRIGMSNTMNNFEHPMIPEGHYLREHVLYKINQKSWLENQP